MAQTLPPPSAEQLVALDTWRAGYDQVCTAAAGSGKSTLLLHACAAASDEDVLIVAYNKPLAAEMTERLAAAGLERAQCFTFHGLCSHAYRLTPDDVTMHEVVAEAEAGLKPTKVVRATRILLDEVQDMRAIFHRLLATLFDLQAVHWLLVGDPVQMLYDYDEDDPAILSFMHTPREYFRRSKWIRTRLSVSFRLTRPLADLANALLDRTCDPLVAGNASVAQPAPRIVTCSNWDWARVVTPIVRELAARVALHEITLLVRSVRADTNRPLANLVNALAQVGCPVYIHGVDGNDARVQRNKLRICTWHASKGTQNKAVIVLGVDGNSQHNPLHVALTRSKCEQIVLQDRRKQHIGLVKAAKTLQDVHADQETLASDADADTDVAPPTGVNTQRVLHNLEHWSPRGRCTRVHALLERHDVILFETEPEVLAAENMVCSRNMWEDATPFYVLAALMHAEQVRTGLCKRTRDMLDKRRVSRDNLRVHIERGSDVRYLDLRLRDGEILPSIGQRAIELGRAPDMRESSDAKWRRWCSLAVCAVAWGGFHHLATRLLPVDWVAHEQCDEIARRVASVEAEAFDVLLTAERDGCLYYTRVPALAKGVAWTFVYADSIGQSSMIRASVPLAFDDDLDKAAVFNLRTGEVLAFQRTSPAKELMAALLG